MATRSVAHSRYVGTGDHELPGSGDELRSARSLFTRALTAAVPAVLASLHAGPYVEFRARLEATFGATDPGDARITAWIRAGGMDAALGPWAAGWHLDVPWVRTRAALTMANWLDWDHAGHGVRLDWGWHDDGGSYELAFAAEELAFAPALPAWQPWLASRAEARALIEASFQRQMAAYLDRVERLCAERGVRKKAQKRQPEHFRWLALYQCAGLEMHDVAATLPEGEHAIEDPSKTARKGVRSAARLIGLPLRPGRKGRPPKRGT